MTESKKKNRKEMAQAYETGCLNRCEAESYCTREKPPADMNKTTGRKTCINQPKLPKQPKQTDTQTLKPDNQTTQKISQPNPTQLHSPTQPHNQYNITSTPLLHLQLITSPTPIILIPTLSHSQLVVPDPCPP